MNLDRIVAAIIEADTALNEIDPIHLPQREAQLFGRAQFKLADALNSIQVLAELLDADEQDERRLPADDQPDQDE